MIEHDAAARRGVRMWLDVAALFGLTDEQLLDRFAAGAGHPAEVAFAALVARHGPMVLRACRAALRNEHDAEDAFQAAFLILARRGRSLRREPLGPWLYRVATRVALRARSVTLTRGRHERRAAGFRVEAREERGPEDAGPVLHAEIERLPARYRDPVILCDLQGHTHEEAATQLGCPVGTIKSRLARARERLKVRLTRRGVLPAAGGLGAILATRSASAVPSTLAATTVQTANVFAVPGDPAVWPVPTSAVVLAEGVLRVMFFQKLKALVLATGLLAVALFAADRLFAGDPPTPMPVPANSAEPALRSAAHPQPNRTTEEQGPSRLLVFRDGHLVLIDPDGKNEKKVTPERLKYYRDARLAPDGKTVAYLVSSGVRAGEKIPVDHQTKLVIRGIDEKGAGVDLGVQCKMFVWSPDGSEIACTEFAERPDDQFVEKTHFVVDVKTKETKPLKIPANHYINDWSSDGKYFLTTHGTDTRPRPDDAPGWVGVSRLYLIKRDGTEPKALTAQRQYCTDGRLSPDGKRVLHRLITLSDKSAVDKDTKQELTVLDTKQELVVLDIQTGKSVAVDLPPKCELLGYCWSPDGKRIAYTWKERHEGKPEDLEKKETKSNLVVCDPDGKNAKTIVTEKGGSPWEVTVGRVDWR